MQGTTSQDQLTASTIAAIQRFHDAFNQHDVDRVMANMAHDCVFENTGPPPDGTRYAGQEAVRAALEVFFRSSPDATFTIEESFACGDREVVRWLYRWKDEAGRPGHTRGVDVLRVRDGKVAESLAYVKG